jgi:dCMP deaminase
MWHRKMLGKTMKKKLLKKLLSEPSGTEFINYNPPSWDVWFMKQVYLAAEKSKDPSTKIGAVLVRDKHVISTGFNGFPIGVLDKKERYADREVKYDLVVHAEDNSVLSAARFGFPTLGATLYTQWTPCCECSKSVIQAGIKNIVIHKQWGEMRYSRWAESCKVSKIMLREAKIPIHILDAKLGLTAYRNGKQFIV